MNGRIEHVTVLGSGLMGAGIAQVTAQGGYNVTLVDLESSLVDKALKKIRSSLERLAKKQIKDDSARKAFVDGVLSRISGSTNMQDAVRRADLVIEAVVENLEVKQKLFAAIDKIARPSTIFASNTSSLSIAAIAKDTQRLDRFCGLHFFNPVPVMKLLEVVRTDETSQQTYDTAMEFGKRVGKTCVTCRDTPGFIVNRLLGPYITEAIKMLERGDASARDIDTAMKLGANYPMGPFEVSDMVGLDTQQKVHETFRRAEPNNPLFQPSKLLDKLVAEGKLGVKTGEGFYKYKL